MTPDDMLTVVEGLAQTVARVVTALEAIDRRLVKLEAVAKGKPGPSERPKSGPSEKTGE